MSTSPSKTILVTGATGHVGSALVPLLTGRGHHVSALGRDPARTTNALDEACAGIDAVFLACGNVPGQVDFEESVIDAAARAGVDRLVKLSARGAEIGSPVAFWHWHGLIERHLQASGVRATVLQPSFLMTNLLEAAGQVREQGMLVAPAGDARISMIDPRDVAAVAATALTDDDHVGGTHVLTGPQALDYSQVAAVLGSVAGHPVTHVDVPPEAAREAMTAAGVPAFAAEQVVNVFAALKRGDQETVTGAVRDLGGSPGTTLAEFARDHADVFGAATVGSVSR